MLKSHSGSDRVILEFFLLITETYGDDIIVICRCADVPPFQFRSQRLNFYGYFATGGN